MKLLNYVFLLLLLALSVYLVYRIRKKAKEYEEQEAINNSKSFTYSYLKRMINEDIKQIIYARPEDMNVSFEEARKRQEMKIKISDAKRDAPVGKLSAKILLTTQISRMLEQDYMINEATIDRVFPFHDPTSLDNHIIFLTLMFTVMNDYDKDAFVYLVEENGLHELRENGRFEIYQSDINKLFRKYVTEIPYDVKKSVLVQRIYEELFGHGNPDILIWQNIEDITFGTGGIAPDLDGELPYGADVGSKAENASFNKVVFLYKGKSIHLRFTGFQSEKELQRICRHIYQYRSPGELTESAGFIENSMADGSRVEVYRNGFGDAWGCCIRKHSEGKLKTLSDMYHQDGCERLIELLTSLMVGCQSCVVTGQMYSGKTTLLRALIEKINPNYNLRGLESVFELYLRNYFPTRNVATFMEKTDIPGDKVLEFLKRTNGTVLVLGELLKEVASNWLISASQSGFKFVLSTHHAVTADALVKWLLNAKLNTSGAGNTELAIEDIVGAIHFNIHCGLNELTGERYVDRVTEIVPTHDESLYITRDIMRFDKEKRCYYYANPLSKRTLLEMKPYMTEEEFKNVKLKFARQVKPAVEEA